MWIKKLFLLIGIGTVLYSCTTEVKQFELIEAEDSGIQFVNKIQELDTLHYFNFPYMYNGGGVGVADFNNDGLEDIFFSGNMVSSKLYINKGSFKFEDHTQKAGLETNSWVMGVSIIDINQDGWQDVYLSVAGHAEGAKRKNKLFVNNGDLTFTEMAAEYGIDDNGHSTQAAFFDMDNDGDLDMYLLTHANEPTTNIDKIYTLTDGTGPSTDRLYENIGIESGHPKFQNISTKAGVTIEGYGLGLSVTDINQDGWLDLYITNDFIADDILYVNNQDGTFTNKAKEYFKQTSRNSMGIDAADINNDDLIDFITLDMLPESNLRKKTMTSNMNHEHYKDVLKNDFSPQFIRNALQLNRGQGANNHPVFSEVGRLAGVYETDWSWSPLFADFDNDGQKDVYITNGFMRDITDHDFQEYSSQSTVFVKGTGKLSKEDLLKKLKNLESVYLPNYMFQNNGNLSFTNSTVDWGMNQASLSNGSAYADFDNDGDLDLVMNTINATPLVYKNNSRQLNKNHYLQLQLKADKGNIDAVGAQLTLFMPNDTKIHQEITPVRGYLSTSSLKATIGVGTISKIDSVHIKWPGGTFEKLGSLRVDTLYTIVKGKNEPLNFPALPSKNFLVSEISDALNFEHTHIENEANDFRHEPLLLHLNDYFGPGIAVGDINGDGTDDVYIGGARNQKGAFLIQKEGRFNTQELADSEKYEDLGALFFDVDQDGDLDLYVVSGGSSVKYYDKGHYQDRIYTNDGQGNFILDKEALPILKASGSCVVASDFDHDGDLDVFVSGAVEPDSFPISPKSYLLENNGGKFTDVSHKAPGLQNIGMVRAALWSDYDNDNDLDLLLAGEWMPLVIYKNTAGSFEKVTNTTLNKYSGMWNSITGADFDSDGDIDYIAGNLGTNTAYKASKEQPLRMYAKDFDQNNSMDPIITRYIQDVEVPIAPRGALGGQLRQLYKTFPSYSTYANASVKDFLAVLDTTGMAVFEANYTNSSYLENLGDGNFKVTSLPIEAQFAPLFGVQVFDINQDGNLDVLGVGNYYETEVISGRYDACKGMVLLGNGKGGFSSETLNTTNFVVDSDAKALSLVKIEDRMSWVATSSAGKTLVFALIDSLNNQYIDFKRGEQYALIYKKKGIIEKQENYVGSGYLSQSSQIVLWNVAMVTKIEFYNENGSLERTYSQNE